jgi:hypothetical protein
LAERGRESSQTRERSSRHWFPLPAPLHFADDTPPPPSSPSTNQLNSTKLLFEQRGPNGCAIPPPLLTKPPLLPIKFFEFFCFSAFLFDEGKEKKRFAFAFVLFFI